MSNELIKNDIDFANQLVEFEKIQETCKKLLATKHYQAIGEAGIHAIIARAKALGIHPFEALNSGFHCINGKIGMSTEMMAALVRRRGHSIRKDPKSTNECVILHGKRADNGDEWTCTFSKADAEAAGLWGTATWKKYSQIMLYNRCMSMLFRQLFPDLSLGAGYVEDELKEIAGEDEYKDPKQEDIEIKVEDVKPLYIEKITDEQAKDLEFILEDCGEDHKKGFIEFIQKNYKANSIQDIPSKSFPALRNSCMKKRDECLSQQKQIAQETKE